MTFYLYISVALHLQGVDMKAELAHGLYINSLYYTGRFKSRIAFRRADNMFAI
jgi:hypothetical protein